MCLPVWYVCKLGAQVIIFLSFLSKIALLEKHLGASKKEAEKICNKEYGGYVSYPKLKELHTTSLGKANTLADTDPEELEELERVKTYSVKCYLLYLVGCLVVWR